MNVIRQLPTLAFVLLLSACAGKATKPSAPEQAVVPADTATASETAAQTPAVSANNAEVVNDGTLAAAATAQQPPSAAEADSTAAPLPPTDAEDDYAALYGGADPSQSGDGTSASQSYDPWQKYNRGMHRFNMAVDRNVARPVAHAYTKVVPHPVRLGVTNFFNNLRLPVTMVNQLLQGHPVYAMQTLGRFVMNSTLGIGGILDPASAAKIPRRSEDFGQTLAVWGWRKSRYFELPFFGPRTLRDTFGLGGDIVLSPSRQIDDDTVRYSLQAIQLVDTRAQLMSLDALRDQAVDEYALTRDAWMQSRNYQIERDLHGRQKQQDDDLPEYLRDESEKTVPADAIPIPD